MATVQNSSTNRHYRSGYNPDGSPLKRNLNMAKKLKGVIVCAQVEKFDVFNWTDPANGQIKPIKSLKALLEHGDGTVERISVSLAPGMPDPALKDGDVYALPCSVTLNKKRQQITYTLRSTPFPAPDMD
jgi:hypothetical protein